ncbi:MAG: N-acetyltransferase [Candidatus Melainabacteria bacterium]|nr:N-acetyltransferase [Candidatus Melainabacteria bacterium]
MKEDKSKKNYFAHKTAQVESNYVGKGSRIWAYVHIMKGAKVGSNCNIGHGAFLESGSKIGNNVIVKNGVSIWDGVSIEDDVFIGPSVAFTNDLRPRVKKIKPNFKAIKTKIKKGATLGANCTILPGLTIGRYSMIGAGAVVTENVPDFALVVGSPATVVSYICVCSYSLKEEPKYFVCKKCHRKYLKLEKGVKLKS